MKYIYPHLGLGDFFICNGMLRKIIRDDEEYLIFSHKQNLESLKFMFRDLKNINFISGYQDYATNDNFVYEYILKNKIQKEDIIRITLTNKFMSHSFDENFNGSTAFGVIVINAVKQVFFILVKYIKGFFPSCITWIRFFNLRVNYRSFSNPLIHEVKYLLFYCVHCLM